MKKENYTITVTPKLEVNCNFSDEYELLIHAHYRNNTPPYERINIRGSSAPKICTLCDKTEPEVSFSKESHVLPASLGNNKYFSFEECNICNGTYGELLESELASMFGLQRSIAGVKGRNIPKIKFHTGETIGFNREKNVAEIVTKEQGKIEIERADGEIKLTVEMPKYKPYDAVLSLLKSAWLLLDQENRKKFPLIRSFIKKELANKTISFFNMFHPGNGTQFTSMKIYKIKDEKKELPPLVIQFSFLNRVLFWHYPLSGKERREVFPQVHFAFHDNKVDVKMNGYTISNPNTEWGGKENLTLKYDRIEEFDGKNDLPVTSNKFTTPEYPKSDVIIRINQTEILSLLTILRFDHEANEFVFEGKELGGKLWFFENKLFKKQEVKFEMNLNKVPLDSAAKTVDFLEQAALASAKVEFLIDGKVFFVAHDAKFNMNLDFEELKQGIEYFKIVNREFGQNFRYAAKLGSLDFKDLRYLASAIQYGSFKETSDYMDKFEITCDSNFLKHLEENQNNNLNLNLQGQKVFNFLGKTFGPFDFEFSLEAPRIDSKTPSSDGKYHFVIFAKSFIQTYPKWYKNETEEQL